MLFWLTLIILLIGILLTVLGGTRWNRDKHPFLYQHDEALAGTGLATIVISGLAIIIMTLVLVINSIVVDADVARLNSTYNALTYKVENESYRDEFGLVNKSVIDEVQAWNENIAWKKISSRNIWIGIFIPNIYDDLQTINYENFTRSNSSDVVENTTP